MLAHLRQLLHRDRGSGFLPGGVALLELGATFRHSLRMSLLLEYPRQARGGGDLVKDGLLGCPDWVGRRQQLLVLGGEVRMFRGLTELLEVDKVVDAEREPEDVVDVRQKCLQVCVARLDLGFLSGHMEPLGFPLRFGPRSGVGSTGGDARTFRGGAGTFSLP
jgi:hypothetical protein